MKEGSIKIRIMNEDDFDSVVEIDEKVVKTSRREYYEMKFDKLFKSKEFMPTSLAAVKGDGEVVGFVMGELYIGEYGISRHGATIDTIGVDPLYRHMGIGKQLINEFIDHLKTLGVKHINTFVDKNDSQLINFFKANQFDFAKSMIALELNL